MIPPVEVKPSSRFLKRIKYLKKSYPHIREDVEPIIEKLREGEILGDQIPATGHTIYKVRIPNRDAQRGKSGGYRMIYYIRTMSKIVLLTIYSKSERVDIHPHEIQDILDELSDEDNGE